MWMATVKLLQDHNGILNLNHVIPLHVLLGSNVKRESANQVHHFHCMDILSSDNKLVWVCHRVTYVNSTVEVGKCIFNCLAINNNGKSFIELPSNVSKLNVMFYDRFNRQGTLCGQCKGGHFPLAYSFDLTCVKCPHSKTNWIKYVLASGIPTTNSILLHNLALQSQHNIFTSSWLCHVQSSH